MVIGLETPPLMDIYARLVVRGANLHEWVSPDTMDQLNSQKYLSAHGGLHTEVLHETRKCKNHCSQSAGFSPWPWKGAGKSRMPLLLLKRLCSLHLSGTAHKQEYISIYIWTYVASSSKKPVSYSSKVAL